ncbi:DHH family phosphoesterase [Maribacter sp. 2307ULW6-5]|uniref:DHH family phosphoesterase n=1 Tax=Maribacter sp. 2307ULW6-5 TaxID=3386275 RepID=UPI0039BD1F7E
MKMEHINALKALLETPREVAIIPHKNPDGDAMGSTLALWHYLEAKGHKATVVAPNDFPKFLKWMPGAQDVLNFERQNAKAIGVLEAAEVIFTLDFNELGRVGQMTPVLERLNGTFVMVDHHQEPGEYAQIMYSDTGMSSTCQMVYHLLQHLDASDAITPNMANCLYTGIMTDTGSFKYRSTTSETHRVIADLMDKGAENTTIHHHIYDTNSPSRLHLLGCALKNMVILEEYATAYITLSQEELDAFQYEKGDTEGFVNYGLTLKGIKFAVIFIENRDEGILKISFRSVGSFSVNRFARAHFNGGGHDNAAGGRSEKSIEDTVAYFTSLLPRYKDALTQ